jgi:hypothetical protein
MFYDTLKIVFFVALYLMGEGNLPAVVDLCLGGYRLIVWGVISWKPLITDESKSKRSLG